QRRHELVPLRRDGVLVDSREIPRRLETIVRQQVHEHAAATQEDLHLLNATFTQPGGDLGPHRLVVTAVLADFGWIVLQAQREPERAHSGSVPGFRSGPW